MSANMAQEEIVPNAESDRITPSVIMFEDDLITVGKDRQTERKCSARADCGVRQAGDRVNPKTGEVRFLPREFDGDNQYSAEELSALILQKLKQDAETYLDTEITDAVITVPAYFGDAEREATREMLGKSQA